MSIGSETQAAGRLGAFDLRDPPDMDGIRACVHCGICLPQCPTYRVLGEEMDSPRGRIYLMRAAAEGRVGLTRTLVRHLDLCLGCRACETACPSGVPFGRLLEAARGQIERRALRPLGERLLSGALLGLLFQPERLGLALRGGGLVLGCVQRLVFPGVNAETARLLTWAGYQVLIPRGQGCCGALHLHTGRIDEARALAARLLARFGREVDFIVTNSAGCGSAMREYPHWLGADRDVEAFALKVRDVSELLAEADLPLQRLDLTVTYHDPCHLAHGQRVRLEPRKLLAAIPGVRLVELADSDLCCGSAGVYSLLEPEMADRLLRGKGQPVAAHGR